MELKMIWYDLKTQWKPVIVWPVQSDIFAFDILAQISNNNSGCFW